MTRSRRRLLWITSLAAAALLIAGTWFYQAYFSSTNAAIRHAEAFLFRRMSVTQLVEQGEYRFFFATNRVRDKTDSKLPLRRQFSSERQDQLTFGSFDTEIKPSLGLGMLINPTEWLQNEEIRLRNIRTLPQAEFTRSLRAKVEKSPHGAVLVVLHGFREAYESALRKTAFLGHVLDVNAPLLLFDWPGNQGSSLRGYRRARDAAKASGAELAKTLELVIRDIQPQQLWVLANSMGAQVVVDAFSQLYRDPEFADPDREIQHVVLTAPDIDHEQFNLQFKGELKALAEHLTVYVSSNDRALLISRLVNRGRRRGESTLSPNQLDEAVRLSELTEPGSDLISLVDVTPVNRTRNFHNFSLETPEFFDDLFLRLTNPEIPNSRPIYHIQTPDGAVYSVLTRGR
ncbi:MAG: alpha/beta hydrolase [Haliea sp.]|jgi:esterase/lipase superfamily enzyme|nr:alpha/beta hydrolase [Haliea sp.]